MPKLQLDSVLESTCVSGCTFTVCRLISSVCFFSLRVCLFPNSFTIMFLFLSFFFLRFNSFTWLLSGILERRIFQFRTGKLPLEPLEKVWVVYLQWREGAAKNQYIC